MTSIPTRDQVPQIAPAHTVPSRPAGLHLPARPSGPAGGLTGKDVLRILRKRMWLIIIASGTVIGLTVVATAIWSLYAPMYTATAALEVTAPEATALGRRSAQVGKDIMDRLMQTHVNMAKSPAVLDAACKNPKLTRTDWYSKDTGGAVERLAKEISIRPVPMTNLIQISMTSIAANDAQRVDLASIVNAVAEEFENFSQTNVRRGLTGDIENLMNARERHLDEQKRIQRKVRMTSNAEGLQERRNSLAIEVRALTLQLIPSQMDLTQFQARLDVLRTQEEEGTLAALPEVFQTLEMDGSLRGLREMKIRLEVERERVRGRFGKRHTNYKENVIALEGIEKQIEQREAELKGQAIAFVKGDREGAVASALEAVRALQERLNVAQKADKDLQAFITTVERLIRTEEKLQDDIAKIDTRLVDLRLLATGERQVTLRIPAIPPREISMPKWKIMIPLGVVLGIAVGLGLAFLLEFIDTSVKSPADISRRIDLPLLGMIPHADDIEEEIDDLRLAFMSHPDSLIGEAFRQIRTCLMFSGPASQRRSLLVTSPLPEDGRTTVALNLAAGFAYGGKKVLVVDANFRQPAIRQLFPECPSGGLSSALVGQAKWDELVHEIQPGLGVLPAGMLPPNPAELLGSEQMRQILEEMVEKYDQVFIDGAPCLVVADSPILATLVDGVILVTRAGANTYGIVQRTRDILHRVGAHIVGVTLNAVRVTAGGYFRESYDTFYEYREQQQLPQDVSSDQGSQPE